MDDMLEFFEFTSQQGTALLERLKDADLREESQ